MRIWSVSFALIILLGCSFNAGCDKDGGGGGDLIGTWSRVKMYQVLGDVQIDDTWTLTFKKDGTFTMLYQRTDEEDEASFIPIASRQGLYSIESDGVITIEGDWLDMTSEITALQDLDGNFLKFTQKTMFLYDEARDLLFFGPDFHTGSSYGQSPTGVSRDGYAVLMNMGDSTYRREAHLVLSESTEDATNVVEQRDEVYEYRIIDSNSCEGNYSYTITYNEYTNTSEGVMQACTYTHDTDITVDAPGGGQIQVEAVNFSYTMDGSTVDNSFIGFGEHFHSYSQGQEEKALVDAAFVRIE